MDVKLGVISAKWSHRKLTQGGSVPAKNAKNVREERSLDFLIHPVKLRGLKHTPSCYMSSSCYKRQPGTYLLFVVCYVMIHQWGWFFPTVSTFNTGTKTTKNEFPSLAASSFEALRRYLPAQRKHQLNDGVFL